MGKLYDLSQGKKTVSPSGTTKSGGGKLFQLMGGVPETYQQKKQPEESNLIIPKQLEGELRTAPPAPQFKDTLFKKVARAVVPDYLEPKLGLREPNIAETMMTQEKQREEYEANNPVKIQQMAEVLKKDPVEGNGFLNILKDTFIPGKVIRSGESPLVNNARKYLASEYQKQHPFLSVIPSIVGEAANLILIGKAGGGFGAEEKIMRTATGIRSFTPTATRIVGKAISGGSIFGIDAFIKTALDQAETRQADLKRLGIETAKGVGFGMAMAPAGSLSTLAGRTIAGGATLGTWTAVEKYVTTGKITKDDLREIAINTAVGALFELAGGRNKSRIFEEQKQRNFYEDKMVADLQIRNPKMSVKEAKDMAIVLEKLPSELGRALGERNQIRVVQMLKDVPPEFSTWDFKEAKTYYNTVVDEVKAGKSVEEAVAIANKNLNITPVPTPFQTVTPPAENKVFTPDAVDIQQEAQRIEAQPTEKPKEVITPISEEKAPMPPQRIAKTPIVEAEKQITTAREVAKDLIKSYVSRGDTMENLKAGSLGVSGDDYSASIGGYIDGKNIGNNKIKVSKIGGKELTPPQIFSLKEIFDELKAETEKPDYAAERKQAEEFKREEETKLKHPDYSEKVKEEYKATEARRKEGLTFRKNEVKRFDNFMAGVRQDMAEDPERDFAAIFYGRGITFTDEVEALHKYAQINDPEFAKLMESGLAMFEKEKKPAPEVPEERGKPEYGKQYRLTGKESIMEGKTWKEAEIKKVSAEITKPKKFKITKSLFREGRYKVKLDESWGTEFFQVKGEMPESVKKLGFEFETRENKFKELVVESNIPTEIVETAKWIENDVLVLQGEGTEKVYIQKRYADTILSTYPNAKFFVQSEIRPVALKENGELVGVVMPVSIKDESQLTDIAKVGKVEEYGKPIGERKGVPLTRREVAERRIPTPAPVVAGQPSNIGGPSEKRRGRVARGGHNERVSSIGKRSSERISNAEIEDLVKSKDTFTDEEKELLKQYTGAGGLERQGAEGRGLLDEYYTPRPAVQLLWDLVRTHTNTLKENLNILEPSVGIGSFLEFAPKKANIEAFEINPISAKIASVLYPDAGIENAPFESLFVTDRGGKKTITSVYDIVIGNPPYGEHRGKYKGLGEESNISKYETYFVKRALDLTKDGGIVAFVLPSSIMRGSTTLSGKKEIAKLGELIDARRLPNSTFAYTDIGTDILIFKKSIARNDFDINVRQSFLSNDAYFEQHQDKILGVEKERKGKWGMEKYVEGTLEGAKDFEEMPPEEIPEREQIIEPAEEVPLGEGVAKVKPEVKKGVNEKAILISEKKDKIKSLAPTTPWAKSEQFFWDKVQATGEVELIGVSEAQKTLLNYQDGKYYTDFNYYHGNIYQKLDQLEKDRPNMESNKYLEQRRQLNDTLPKKQTFDNIIILPTSAFAKDMMFGPEESLLNKFREYIDDLPYNAFESSSKWEINGYINGDIVRGSDKVMNAAVRNRRRRIGDKLMKKFITEELNEEERKALEDKYNRFYNNYVRPDYTKVPLTALVNSTFKKEPLNVHPIQLEGAGFLVNKGVGLLAYDVGVGKTMTGILAINEVLKKGWAKKPLIVVPNSVYSKWIYEIQEIIPGVKINSLANLGGTFKGDLATLGIEEGTLSIITYDGLIKLGFTEETYQKMLINLQDVMSGVNTTKRGEAKEKENIAEAIGRAARETRSDRFFEDLGFDHVTIDEVHNFKNIFAGAKMEDKNNEFKNVRGSTSNRGIKLYVMTQYVLDKNKGRGVFGLSATPFSNSPLEIYSILSLFAKKRIEEMGIKNVNDFMTMFMKLETKMQIKANRTVKEEDTIETFHNLQELQKLISEYIDFRSSEDAGVKRPSKKRNKIILFPTSTQLNYLDRAQELYNDKDAGGAIVSITEQRSITLSPYLSRYNDKQPTYKEFVENSPKLKFVMEAIGQVKKDNPKVNQLIYMAEGVEYFPLIKEYLIRELGYKADNIDFIKGGMSADKKYNIQNNLNNPKHPLKIIIGSDAMKEGMDLHKLTTELYVMQLPWNPSGLMQVEGRMWRPNNEWKNVRVHYPLIENSVDQFLFQKLETKEKRINNIWSYTGREIDVGDIDFEELKMDLITDPVMKVDAEEKMAHAVEQGRLETAQAELAFMEHQVQSVEDIKTEIERVEEEIRTGEEGQYWYDESVKKLPKLKKKLIKANERLRGVDLAEFDKRIEAKKAEIEKQEKVVDNIRETFKSKREEAGKQRVETIVKPNDYAIHVAQIANENKATFYHRENDQNIQDEPLGGSEGAAIGAFAENTPIELGGLDKVRPVEFPEMVQLAKELTGRVPFLKKYKKALGRFYGRGMGRIGLNPELFKRENTQQLAKALAHEIGHLIDYLPEQTLKRGGILRRLYSMTKFTKETFGKIEIKNKDVRSELIAMSSYWRPWERETSTESFRRYRDSSKELYADAISMLLNTPGTLQRMAPIFYDTFFEQLDNKPEVKNAYFELQSILTGERSKLIELRRTGVKEMFTSGDYKAKELQHIKAETRKKRMSDIMFRLKFELLDKGQAVIDRVHKLEKEGIHINPDDNPVYYLEEKNYLGGKIKAILQQKFQPIYDEVTKADIAWSDFGEALMYERILAGDRTELANPRGLTPDAVLELYNDLKTQMGTSWPLMEAQMDAFRERLKEVATEAYNEGLYTPELYAQMLENPKYVTFQVIDHLEDGMSSKVHHQVGTLKDITNPADASLLKMVATIKAIEQNKVRRSIADFLNQYFKDEIKPAKVIYVGKGTRAIPSRQSFEELLIVMEKGKAKGYYIDDYIKKSVDGNSIGQNSAVLSAIKFSNRAWFRPAFITFNLGFQGFNLIRDFLRFWKNTPGITFFRSLKRYGEAYHTAKVRAFGLPANPTPEDIEAQKIIQSLEYDQVFSVKFSDFMLGENAEDTQIQTLMQTYSVIDGKTKKGIPGLTPILNWIKNAGDLVESLSKVAGYYELRDGAGKLTKEQKSFIRRKVGSPDFLAGGHLKPWSNELFLFSNAIMQGIRSDIEVAIDPKTRGGYWWKTAKLNLLPKILMLAVLMGLFGEKYREMMENASEYDKTNYTIIPLGISNGKSVYLRIPQDEMGRVFGGLFWKMLKVARPGSYSMTDITDIVSFTAGQLPSLTPTFETMGTIYQYLSGKNPYDTFRGRYVLTDDEFRAGGWYSLKPFLQWEWNQLGGGIFMRFNTGNVSTKQSMGEKLLNLPIISNVIGRFIKVSNYGQTELNKKITQEVQKEESRTRLDQNAIIDKYIQQYHQGGGDVDKFIGAATKEAFGGKVSTIAEIKRFQEKVKTAISRGENDPNINALISAVSVDEQIALLKQFKKNMSKDEFDKLFIYAQESKIISKNTAERLNQ